jgi:hypothetical protein
LVKVPLKMQLETSSNITLSETPDPRICPITIFPRELRGRQVTLLASQRYMPVMLDSFWIIANEINTLPPHRERAEHMPIERPSQNPVTSSAGGGGR